MITGDPEAFLAAFSSLRAPRFAAVPSGVFLVMPEAFRVDDESAADNPYMDLASPVDPQRALAQAEELAKRIEVVGVAVTRFPGDPACPDGVFPNNVFGTAPGRFIVGRMRHPGRRREAMRADIRTHFAERELFDLSVADHVCELTGPLVIDRACGVAYCGMSGRVDAAGLAAMHAAFDLALTYRFDLVPGEYHTNVVLSVLAGRACVLYPGAFAEPGAADTIAAAYPGRTLKLDAAEKQAFTANCIALTDSDLFLSATAGRALRPGSRLALEAWGFTLHEVELDEIEKAGGSLRCMVAEIYD